MPRRARGSANGRGRPTLFENPKRRNITITDVAYAKAAADAEVMTGPAGFRVTTSQAIEAAIRAFDARRFEP